MKNIAIGNNWGNVEKIESIRRYFFNYLLCNVYTERVLKEKGPQNWGPFSPIHQKLVVCTKRIQQ